MYRKVRGVSSEEENEGYGGKDLWKIKVLRLARESGEIQYNSVGAL